jgi:hypothetical protein
MARLVSVETSIHVRSVQGFVDSVENGFRPAKDIAVPEPQCAISH